MNKDNNGIVILNANRENEKSKTVVVLGVPRGGTSMVSGTLSKLGVYMGEEEKLAPFYENTELWYWIKKGDKKKAREIISKNNSLYAIWGVKILPQNLLIWLSYRAMFPETAYVVVFRDILAIAKRRVVSLKKGFLQEMFRAMWMNFCLLTFIAMTKRPVFLISYEKALLFPDEFVDELALFLNINDPDKAKTAIEFIKPSPAEYRIRSTTDSKLNTELPYFGYVDNISQNKIIGWVLSTEDTNSLEVELWINGVFQQKTVANVQRADVADSKRNFHKNCGFEFQFSEENYLKSGDVCEVKTCLEKIELINSPQKFI